MKERRMNSCDIDVKDFRAEYDKCSTYLKKIVGASEQYTSVVMTGEGMLGLWGSLHSCLASHGGNRVFVATNGFFGDCFYEMACAKAQQVSVYRAPWNVALNGAAILAAMDAAGGSFDVVLMVMVETPSGIHNTEAMKAVCQFLSSTPTVFIVDCVSGMGGMDIDAEKNGVDIVLGGSQKVLALPPSLSILCVSPKAWRRISACAYEGYDALSPFSGKDFPYTMDWGLIAALSCEAVQLAQTEECLAQSILLRYEAAKHFRNGLTKLGVSLYVMNDSDMANTVTVANIPSCFSSWDELNAALRKCGMMVGSSWGALQGKVFRVGHMSRSQCKLQNVNRLLDAIASAITEKQKKSS